ncbi:MAG: hypothetical protein AB4352_22075 [Hormoscilla sp.]
MKLEAEPLEGVPCQSQGTRDKSDRVQIEADRQTVRNHIRSVVRVRNNKTKHLFIYLKN